MLVAHMGEFDKSDLLRRLYAVASLPGGYAFAVGTNCLRVWDGITTVRRGFAAGRLERVLIE
jgi:hypothetical protein